jgi:predicted outer membrane repeat protein
MRRSSISSSLNGRIKRRRTAGARSRVEALEERRLLSAVLYVDTIAPGSNNGSSWANAYTSLQLALSVATAGTTIEVGQGTYSPGTAPTATFELINGVNIDGGYAGYGTSNPDARSASSYVTTLTGNGTSYHVVTGSGTNSTAVLDGLTITAGSTNSFALYNVSASPTIDQCTFTDNAGGGMYDDPYSAPNVSDCEFIGNTSAGAGGAIYSQSSLPSAVTNCLFVGNSALGSGPHEGGGAIVVFGGGVITITNCTFSQNTASLSQGGAIYTEGGPPIINNCILWGDGAPLGSEIYNYDGLQQPVMVGNSDVEGGYAGTGNINSNPQFVDPTADDFQIQSYSPCVDAGNNVAVPSGVTTDLAGDSRFQDVPTSAHTGSGTVPIVDVGAYEATAAL